MIVIGGGPAGASTAMSCSSLGLNVLLLERGSKNRDKPCGGVLPWIVDEVIEGVFGESIPDYVKSTPAILGLYYVPPSGVENGGAVKNYKIHNINRIRFDQWLRNLAEDAGAEIKYNSRFLSFSTVDPNTVIVETPNGMTKFKSRYIVGADGVRSRVRSFLFPNEKFQIMTVRQEHIIADSDLGSYFYAFLRGDISPSYAYAIPKDDVVILGAGVIPKNSPTIIESLELFKKWLAKEFSLGNAIIKKQEMWSIPFGFFQPGVGNVLLVGDAAGLCNPLSGEGIRLAVESGEFAAYSIAKYDNAIEEYTSDVKSISDFVTEIYSFVTRMTDDDREQFVKEELQRRIYFE